MNSDRKCRSPQLGSESYMPPLILNTDLIKLELKTGYPYNSIWDRLDWESAVITTTLCSTANGESLIYPSIKSWNNPGVFLKLCKCSQTQHPSPRVASTPTEQSLTTIRLIIYKHSTHTKLRHLARGRSEEKLSNPWVDKRKSWTHLPSSLFLINTRNKKNKSFDSPSALISFSYTRNKKRNLSTW